MQCSLVGQRFPWRHPHRSFQAIHRILRQRAGRGSPSTGESATGDPRADRLRRQAPTSTSSACGAGRTRTVAPVSRTLPEGRDVPRRIPTAAWSSNCEHWCTSLRSCSAILRSCFNATSLVAADLWCTARQCGSSSRHGSTIALARHSEGRRDLSPGRPHWLITLCVLPCWSRAAERRRWW
jgi:hypothetical protein